MSTVIVPSLEICLIDFNTIFKKIQREYLDKLYEYELIKDNKIIINNDSKKLFYHYVIFNICEHLVNNRHHCKKIIYIPNKLNNFEIFKFDNSLKINKLLFILLNQIKNKLPISFFFQENTVDFDKLTNNYFRDEGNGLELRNILENLWGKFEANYKYRNFSKIKEFAKKNGLIFLDKEYFNNLKTKQLFYK